MSAVTVYVKPSGCQGCTITKRILDRAGIKYTAIDITTDAEAFEYVTGTLGFQRVPAVVLDGPVVKDENGEPLTSWSDLRPDLLKQLQGA